MSSNTAILLFSRTASEEAAVKVFDPRLGRDGNRSVARALIRHTGSVARKAGLPLVTCFGSEQVGASFGARLANAVEAVFARGYGQVIAIGNDCPAVTPNRLREARERLDAGEMVLGPAADGGLYLIGFSREAYDRERFLSLPWQTAEMQEGWTEFAAETAFTINWLTRARDIDNAADFRFWMRKMDRATRLWATLTALLAIPLHAATAAPFIYLAPALHAVRQRGPPH